MSRVLATKRDFVIALPCLSTKNGPAWSPLELMHCKTANTGQRLPVRPNMMSDPVPNGSHFELLKGGIASSVDMNGCLLQHLPMLGT